MDPLRATAEVGAGEAMQVVPIAQARMVGGNGFLTAYQGIGLFAGLFLGSILAGLLPLLLRLMGIAADWRDEWVVSLSSLITLIGTVVGFAMGVNAGARRHARKFLQGIRARGTPELTRVSYTVEPEAFVIAHERVSHRIAWPAIQEIIPAPEHWLVQVDTLSFVLPKRAFADEAAERHFLGGIVARLDPAARERSPEATAFGASPAAG